MEQLFARVSDITGVDEATARTAVGHVLLFLRDQAPQGHIGELIDKDPIVRQAVSAALATSDGGVTGLIAASESFIGEGRFDTLALKGKLDKLGLDDAQIDNLLTEVFAHADTLLGADGVEEIKRDHPEMAPLVAAAHSHAPIRRSI
jgi:DNA-binding NarL/FixJ family response regulator